jgi:toxin ParE1/3/4
MRITWSTTARQDLVHIRSYIARFHPAAAAKVATLILDAVEPLSRHSEMGTRTTRPDIRRLVVPSSPYVIYYRLQPSSIEIIEVFDGRRAAPRALRDDD